MEYKKRLERSIQEHRIAIYKAQAELAKLEMPKLKHGDYGYDCEGNPCMVIHSATSGHLHDCGRNVCHDNIDRSSPIQRVETKLGNIFDDLERKKMDS